MNSAFEHENQTLRAEYDRIVERSRVIAEEAQRAQSLDDLFDILKELDRLDSRVQAIEAITLDHLDRPFVIADITDLPVFGRAPEDTHGIYSWDDTRFLYLDGKWILEKRNDLEEESV